MSSASIAPQSVALQGATNVRPSLESLSRDVDPLVRAEALAQLAISEATSRSEEGLARARGYIEEASALGPSGLAAARLAHARAYLAYRESDDDVALREANEAATLYAEVPTQRARVFDLIGMMLSRRGDLDGAYDYFMLSIALKKQAGAEGRGALALTYGNLGRLELMRERFVEAERWMREDLELVLEERGRPATEAHVRNQLAMCLLGQGEARRDEARRELEAALELSPRDSIVHVYIAKDLAMLALDEGREGDARALLSRAEELTDVHRFAEVTPWLRFVHGRLRASSADAAVRASASSAFEEAWAAFGAKNMPQQACDVAIAWAGALIARGQRGEAIEILQRAQHLAEEHLFRQENPLARIESMIDQAGDEGASAVLRGRVRRMLGGVSEHWLLERHSGEYHHRRLFGERAWITVWTCDIRGFTEYCNRTSEPGPVVKMLNRFFARVGQSLLSYGGCIDKYVGDSILAYFQGPSAAVSAVEVSLEAFAKVAQLNEERAHLGEAALQIGVGISTGWVVEGNVGFAGKLEHTIIGTPVNTACRLVAKADVAQVLMCGVTREALGERFEVRPVGEGGALSLKGLGQVATFELVGRRG